MSDIEYNETLLKNYLILMDPLPKTKEEYSESTYAFLDTCLRTDVTWNWFFDNNFNIFKLKSIFMKMPENERFRIFKFGIACLLQFVNCNFTGPGLEEQTEAYLNLEKFSKYPFREVLNGIHGEINVNTKFPALLLTAKIVFKNCIVNEFINNWWIWRVIIIHANILEAVNASAKSEADEMYKLLLLHIDSLPMGKYSLIENNINLVNFTGFTSDIYSGSNKANIHKF